MFGDTDKMAASPQKTPKDFLKISMFYVPE
jgi:hypothetical protein